MSERVHEIKCIPDFFYPLVDGTKNFEIRFNDRDYRVGDRLCVHEWNPRNKEATGRQVVRVVTYITDFSQVSGWIVMGLKG